jgi:REP element-mobilizing transposase RayT
LGNVIPVGIGRDLCVHKFENNSQNQFLENHHPKFEIQLNQYGLIVEEKINWLREQYSYVEIHNYQVMPNHFHLILEIDSLKVKGLHMKIKSLSSLMGAMKITSSKLIRDAGFLDFEWHRSFHDHIIKNEKSYDAIYNYIGNNPDNWRKDSMFQSV